MDQPAGQSAAGMSAPYGQACAGCVKAKCKCVSRGSGNCERYDSDGPFKEELGYGMSHHADSTEDATGEAWNAAKQTA